MAGVGRVREEPLHRRRRRVEVGHRLEEGDDVEPAFDPGVPGHQEDGEQVARPARHAHDVALDRGGADPLVGAADEAEEVERLVRGGAEVEPVRREGPPGLDLGGQQARALVLARLGVRAAPRRTGRAPPRSRSRAARCAPAGRGSPGGSRRSRPAARGSPGGRRPAAARRARPGFAGGGAGPPGARARRRRCRGGRGGRPATAGCSPPASPPACGRRTAASGGRAAGGSAPRPASPPPGRARRPPAGSRRAPRRRRAARSVLRWPWSRSMPRRSSRSARSWCARSVSSVAATVTNGLPSRSPPIQLPKRRKPGRTTGARVLRGHRPLERGRHLGREVVEDGLEVVEAVADLVHHVRLVGPRLLRPPQRDELLAQHLVGRALLLRGRRLEVEPAQHVGDAGELGEDRPPLGLGRVRGEDRHDQQPVEERLHLLRGRAGLPQLADRRPDRLDGRAAGRVRLALAPAQHADALLLLREVDELEVRGEGLHHAARLGEGQRLDAPQQPLARRLVAGAVRLGEAAHVLDEVEERLAPPARRSSSPGDRRAGAPARSAGRARRPWELPECSRGCFSRW